MTRFDLEFAGELTPGADPTVARQRLTRLFGLPEAAAAKLWSGARVVVKRAVDADTAARLHDAFRRAGAVVHIVPAAGEEPPRAGAATLHDPFGWTAPAASDHSPLHRLFHGFEKILAFVLLMLIAVVAVIAVIELCFVLYQDLTSRDGFLLGLHELFEVFGMFLIVLIAVELMASVYMYMMDKSVHVEMMLLIAITALTRKVVVLDLEGKGEPAMYMLGLAALLATLIGGYFLVRRLDQRRPPFE